MKANGVVVVFVPEYGIESKIDLKETLNLEDKKASALAELFEYDHTKLTLCHKASGKMLKVFDEVKVKLAVKNLPGRREKLVITLLHPSLNTKKV